LVIYFRQGKHKQYLSLFHTKWTIRSWCADSCFAHNT